MYVLFFSFLRSERAAGKTVSSHYDADFPKRDIIALYSAFFMFGESRSLKSTSLLLAVLVKFSVLFVLFTTEDGKSGACRLQLSCINN